jgi:16S rRNA (cytidine1402-2'-O)-methyltransferase
MLGTLYLVATPIGNLQDITFRAVEILKTVSLIACEDTRHTRKLLNHYGISNRLVSYHEHNEHERAEELAEALQGGKSIAVVSDAGTPAICDPAFRIVQKALIIGARVVSIPGAAAFCPRKKARDKSVWRKRRKFPRLWFSTKRRTGWQNRSPIAPRF